MIGSIQSAVSGLLANQKRVDAAANNIANVDTKGYRKQTVQLSEAPNGGVVASAERSSSPTRPTGTSPSENFPPSDVDLTEEIPSLTLSKDLYKANLAVIKTQDEMRGSLLDLRD